MFSVVSSVFHLPQKGWFSMPIHLTPMAIGPESAEWDLFLEMNFQYMSENWLKKMGSKTVESFKSEYDQMLRDRIAQGGRGLFLYFDEKKTIGFSNVYLTEERGAKVLHIAEFYVAPEYRKRGMAVQMKDHLIAWGKAHSATELRIEVDKDLETAVRFWSKFGFQLNSDGPRNVYSTPIL